MIKGDILFDRYLNKPEATAKEFKDGWFKTGDYVKKQADGTFRILGRMSQDIIKKAGYKISGLEIESHLLEHSKVTEVCVLGIADEKYGEEIACVFCGEVSQAELESFAREKMSSYKLPKIWKQVSRLERNQMGKVSKKQIRALYF